MLPVWNRPPELRWPHKPPWQRLEGAPVHRSRSAGQPSPEPGDPSRGFLGWVAPPERHLGKAAMEKSLCEAADQFRANSGLKAQEYSGPILGLIFLRFADARFMPRWRELKEAGGSERRGSREEDPYQSEGLLYLPPGSRYQELLDNPGRYVGVAAGEDLSDEDFKEQLEKLQEELEGLNAQARELEATIAATIAATVAGMLEA